VVAAVLLMPYLLQMMMKKVLLAIANEGVLTNPGAVGAVAVAVAGVHQSRTRST
jgi:hypothetical protein